MTRWLTLTVFLAVVLISSCASTMVGRQVNTNQASFCYCYFLPAKCSTTYDFIHIDYEILKGDGENKYIVSGKATYTGSITWTDVTKGLFRLLLIADEQVFQEVSIPVFSGDISRPIVFERAFKTEKVPTHAIMGYSFSVLG